MEREAEAEVEVIGAPLRLLFLLIIIRLQFFFIGGSGGGCIICVRACTPPLSLSSGG